MFIQFRLTPKFALNPEEAFVRMFLRNFTEHLDSLGDIVHQASVWESKNKFGEETHKHLHWNLEFYENEILNKDSLMAWLRRQPIGIKGNKCYSLKIVADPQDEKRWWRYLLKEADLNKGYVLPQDFDEFIECQCARDERNQQVIRNLASRDKLLKKDSFRLRIFAKMKQKEAELGHIPTDKFLWCEFVKMYQEDNRIPPFNTMDNLVLDYKCYNGILTPEEYYDSTH